MDLGLDGRVYLITGGSKGLGYATARALVDDGARVVISSRSEDAVSSAVDSLGRAAVGHVGDNADAGLPDELVSLALSRFGRLDGMLVSVGGPPQGEVLDLPEEAWVSAFSSLFLGTLRLMRAVAPALPDGGAIALVLSTSVREPLPSLGISNGLRPGLAMVAKSLAGELGPRGVRVVSLLPGGFATERNAALLADPERLARREAGIPLGRLGQPEEFGRVAAFALSPAASYVTGSAWLVDGGAVRGL